jgi:hypothetical protein
MGKAAAAHSRSFGAPRHDDFGAAVARLRASRPEIAAPRFHEKRSIKI